MQMAKIGRKYSAMIYVIHPAFLSQFNLALENHIFEPVYCWLSPIIIFMEPYWFSVLYDKVKPARKP